MNILLPKTIDSSSFLDGTSIPEVDDDAGEVAWATGQAHAAKSRKVWKGYWYECVKDISTAPDNAIEPSAKAAAALWLKDPGAPSNRIAPFDKYLFTAARRKHTLTYVLRGVFVDGLRLESIESDNLHVRVQAGDSGVDLVPPVNMGLWQQPFDEWEYLFGDLQRGKSYSLSNIPIHPHAVITITLTRNDPDVDAAVGYISLGNWKRLLSPMSNASGVQYGVEVATKDYSFVDDFKDGTYTEVEGHKATNINLNCVIDSNKAPAAKALLDAVLGKTVAFDVSDLPKYSHLAGVGKITGTVRTSDWPTAQVDIQFKGNV